MFILGFYEDKDVSGSWRDISVVRSTVALAEDLGSFPAPMWWSTTPGPEAHHVQTPHTYTTCKQALIYTN